MPSSHSRTQLISEGDAPGVTVRGKPGRRGGGGGLPGNEGQVAGGEVGGEGGGCSEHLSRLVELRQKHQP